MALEARHHEPCPKDGEAASAITDVECDMFDEAQIEAIQQSCAAQDQFPTSIGADQSKLVDEGAGELAMAQPALKRLRCRVLHINSPLVIPSAVEKSGDDDDDDELLRADMKACSVEQCTLYVRDHESEINVHGSIKVEEQGSARSCKAESEEAAGGKELECKTPTAREQRIPESRDLVCPPPPIKKKATAFKRTSRPSDNRHRHANLMIEPPDLHTFPECIRALFDK